nr:hypothetical protein [Tanacetum cinerariifolium]
MAILVISITSDSSYESLGSSPSRIILFGIILAKTPAEILVIPPVAPEVKAAKVALPAGVLDLITYCSTDSDSSEDPSAQVTSLFLHSFDSSKTSIDSAISGSLERPPLQDPYKVIIVHALPGVPLRPAILVLPSQEIPFGRPYHTQPNEVRKMLTTRKRVRALPSGRLASRYPPDHSSSYPFSSDVSSSDSLSDYSSNSSSGHSLLDSSFSFDDSSSDTPATIYKKPSCKRHMSPANLVPLATHTPGALSPMRVDLLPPHKRIRCFADIDANTAAVETAVALEVSIGIEADVGVEVGIETKREDKVREEAESGDRDRIGVLEGENMRLRGMVCVERERVDILRRHMSYTQEELRTMPTTTRFGMTRAMIEEMIERDGLGGGNRNRNPNVNVRGVMPVTHECTYQDFMKCQQLNFKALMKLMTERFQELVLLCTKMVPEEEDQVEKFIGGLPDDIQGNVIAAEPTRLQDAI